MDPEQAKFQPVETSLGNPIAFRLEVLNGRSQLNWAQRDPSIQNTRHERTLSEEDLHFVQARLNVYSLDLADFRTEPAQ